MLTRHAVFLDRDGTINRATMRNGRPYSPASVAQFDILPGVPEALERLRAADFRIVVVTNQPDVARGLLTRATVEAMHDVLRVRLSVDEIRVCFHDDRDQCACRKPAPGLLLAAARDSRIDLASSYMVGDRWRDVEAGKRAGCTTIFIDQGYEETQPSPPHVRVESLPAAADWILAHTLTGRPRP